jgi:alkylation response protein AidB-like acyl-CoA dehydrogenase
MDFRLTKEQEQLVEKAKWLAEEKLAPRAQHYDKTATHPKDSWKDIWDNGLLGIAIPKEFGGLGLDMLSYVLVVETLTQGCTSTGMTVHMHSVVQRFISELGTQEQKKKFFAEVIEDGRVFGSWGSEPARRGGTGTADSIVSKRDGGYYLNGRKHFCTMAGATRRSIVHSTMKDMDAVSGYILAIPSEDDPGQTIIGEWDTLGMRATISPSVSFEDCELDEDEILGTPGRGDKLGIGQSFGLGYASVYLGAAQMALDFVKDYSRNTRFDPDPNPMSHTLPVQGRVTEMTMALEGARLSIYRAASLWEESNPFERAVLSAKAKYLATEAALMVTEKAIQTVGGRSAHASNPLGRVFRDVRTCTLMPPNSDRQMEIIGRAEMGVDSEGDEMLSRLTHFVS